ncbi:MAG TPA: hypothetical protein VFJ30_00885 [Phycisphaerae bacterium]|nr:hypothetical protein [Phycisphaerae bacterium]
MKRTLLIATVLVLAFVAAAPAETVKCKATRDVWLSAMGAEADDNMGAARTIKLKVWQEFGIADFDVAALKGKKISAAYVYVKPAGGQKLGLNAGTDLRWLTVSTVSHDWVEGTSARYGGDPDGGGATFNESSYRKRNWGFEGAKAWDVILGNGNTLRCDRWMDPANGWLKAKIDPRMVQALVAGASHGLLLMDGSTSVGVNCTINARESGNGPYLEVVTDGEDTTPPAAPTNVKVAPAPNHATPENGAAMVSLTVPAGAFAYQVTLNGKPLERWQVPFAAEAGSTQTFPILDLPGGEAVKLEIAAVDEAGNVGPSVSASGAAGPKLTVPKLPAVPFTPTGGAPPKLAGATVWAFPEITKVHPASGKVLNEKVSGDIRQANAVWDGATRTVRLAAARGEIISFQVGIDGTINGVKLTVAPGVPDAGIKLWRNWYVQGQSEYAIPLTDTLGCPMPDNAVAGQTHQAVTVDIHVPKGTRAGTYAGSVALSIKGAQLALPLKIKVYDVVIPDEVFFNPELNCYSGPGSAGSDRFKNSYRIAHYNRCTINRVPYNQGGNVHTDWTPAIDASGRVTDWSRFDRDLGGLLDGSWFADNPRAGVPVPTMYLPLFEGWPKDFRKHYNPGPGVSASGKDTDAKLRHDILAKPIEEAMDAAFKQAFVNCTSDFVAHAKAKGWNKTLFEMYLNNKPNYGYTMWTLDEPFEYLDWAALNFLGRLYKEGINDPAVYEPAFYQAYFEKGLTGMKRDRPTFLYRGDVSRPMWQGNVSDGIMTILYSGGVFTQMPRLLRATRERAPMILYAYGSCNAPNRSNWESAAWCLRTYTLNGDGVLPWQSLGGPKSLTAGDAQGGGNALIIDAGKYGNAVASFRVHALRRGAQDAELLRLLQLKNGWSREHMGVLVSQKVPLASTFKQEFTDQAAAVTFGTLTSQGFCEMKEGVLQLLNGR